MSQTQILHALLQQISSEGKRSTAMQPLIWLLSILLFGTLSSFYFSLPIWVGKILIGLVVLIILVFVGVYIYLMLTNSDALRSEKYSLNKMAIQKSILGDDLTGIVIDNDTIPQNVIETSTEEG